KASLSPAGEMLQVTSPPHAMGSELAPLVSCEHTVADSGSVVLVVVTATVVVVAPASVVVVTTSVVVVVDVPLTWHASQQLGDVPACPPFAVQRAALFIGLQRVPRQHATAPDRPQVERAAHWCTAVAHARGSSPPATRFRTTPAAQRT